MRLIAQIVISAVAALASCDRGPSKEELQAENLKRIEDLIQELEKDRQAVQQAGRVRCNKECEAFEKGYLWAEENEVSEPDECFGSSDAFLNGCMAYAEEHAQAAR